MGTRTATRARTDAHDDLSARAVDGILGPNPFIGLRGRDITATVVRVARQAIERPTLALEQEAALVRELISVLAGKSRIAVPAGDKRFQDVAWKASPFYRMVLQGYLAWRQALNSFVDRSAFDYTTKQRARFVVSLLTDALAPTNSLLGNPAAVKKTLESGGGNIVKGIGNMLSDLRRNGGMPTQVDTSAFKLGKNLALSPGAVVFRNSALELIQYAPATPEVFARPHLIVPPQVNKFYLFDLAPGRSLVEYLVKSGFQVFAVSWRNPTAAHRDWDVDTYVAALLEALSAVRDITGSEDVNLHGACSGAMTITALLGYLATKQERVVNAATMLVSVLGSKVETQLGLFATTEAIAAAKRASKAKGVLEGQQMGRVFAWMRPNDLIWNYWVNNYLMGNPPSAFDILYWNSDTTRLPATFHAQLIDIFVKNLLVEPAAMSVLGAPVDISKIDCDKFVVAGMTDHITPWKAVFHSARNYGGTTEFVLSSSGHVQSVVNPPGNPKAKFFTNHALPANPERWLAKAKPTNDSWWPYWREWLAARSGPRRSSPKVLGNKRYKPGKKAPGNYVLEP